MSRTKHLPRSFSDVVFSSTPVPSAMACIKPSTILPRGIYTIFNVVTTYLFEAQRVGPTFCNPSRPTFCMRTFRRPSTILARNRGPSIQKTAHPWLPETADVEELPIECSKHKQFSKFKNETNETNTFAPFNRMPNIKAQATS